MTESLVSSARTPTRAQRARTHARTHEHTNKRARAHTHTRAALGSNLHCLPLAAGWPARTRRPRQRRPPPRPSTRPPHGRRRDSRTGSAGRTLTRTHTRRGEKAMRHWLGLPTVAGGGPLRLYREACLCALAGGCVFRAVSHPWGRSSPPPTASPPGQGTAASAAPPTPTTHPPTHPATPIPRRLGSGRAPPPPTRAAACALETHPLPGSNSDAGTQRP